MLRINGNVHVKKSCAHVTLRSVWILLNPFGVGAPSLEHISVIRRVLYYDSHALPV